MFAPKETAFGLYPGGVFHPVPVPAGTADRGLSGKPGRGTGGLGGTHQRLFGGSLGQLRQRTEAVYSRPAKRGRGVPPGASAGGEDRPADPAGFWPSPYGGVYRCGGTAPFAPGGGSQPQGGDLRPQGPGRRKAPLGGSRSRQGKKACPPAPQLQWEVRSQPALCSRHCCRGDGKGDPLLPGGDHGGKRRDRAHRPVGGHLRGDLPGHQGWLTVHPHHQHHRLHRLHRFEDLRRKGEESLPSGCPQAGGHHHRPGGGGL